MSIDMNDVVDLKLAMSDLISHVKLLIKLCVAQDPNFVGFNIERITKTNEKEVIRRGIDNLSVDTLASWSELYTVLDAWGKFYKSDELSTKFVDRLPGIVVINGYQEEIISTVETINELKSLVATIVRNNRDHFERHEFIHTTFPFIMTEQVYRKIHVFSDHVTNTWFNWASRPVPKTFTIDEACVHLEQIRERPKFMYTPNEWQAIIDVCKNDFRSGLFSRIQKLKEFRVLPTVELQYIDDEGVKKRSKRNATTPIILLGQKDDIFPKISLLGNYKAAEKRKKTKLSKNKIMINRQLGFVGVK
jgi:hypothetical protein